MVLAERLKEMVVVAQLVRAPDCDSGGRRFNPGHPPDKIAPKGAFLFHSQPTRHLNMYLGLRSIAILCDPVNLHPYLIVRVCSF